MTECIFCKIINGEIPCYKLIETEHTLAFLDINPRARGHTLIVPKYHAEKLHEMPDEALQDTLIVAKRVAKALEVDNYNLLQNNGELAFQEIKHVHFHLIPKRHEDEGLRPAFPPVIEEAKTGLDEYAEELRRKINQE